MLLQLQLKGMPSSKLCMQKGYLFSIKCIRNGYLFYPKWYIKAVGPRGGTFPTITFLSIPPTPCPLTFVHMQWNHAKGMNLLNTTMGTKRWYLRQPPHLSSGVCFVERRWPENAWLWVLRWWGTPLIELNGYVQCNRIWCSWSWVFKNRVYNFTTGWPFAQKPLNDREGWWWGVYICGETKLKKEAHIHHPTAWPVPHTCAQPYHPQRGSHG